MKMDLHKSIFVFLQPKSFKKNTFDEIFYLVDANARMVAQRYGRFLTEKYRNSGIYFRDGLYTLGMLLMCLEWTIFI